MAISAATVWEVRASGGSDNNGGGFTAGSGGTDYSQSNTPIISVTDGHTTGGSSVTSASGPFTAAMVGNLINIVGDGIYQILSFTNSTLIGVDRATGSGSGQTLNVGGALATLTKLLANMVASNKAYVTGAFTTTATLALSQASVETGALPPTRLIGYGSTRGDNVHATLTLQTNTGLIGINMTGGGWTVENIDVDCASLATSTGFVVSAISNLRNCKASSFTLRGIRITGTEAIVKDCEVTGGTGAATAAIDAADSNGIFRCYVHDNSCPGIIAAHSTSVRFNVVANNTGGSSDGVRCNNYNNVLENNTIHNNGRDGIRNNSANFANFCPRNNLLTNNGGFGINGTTGTALGADSDFDGNAFFGNTSGARTNMDSTAGIYGVNPYTNVRDVILTASPYVGPTTGSTANFGLNNNPGAGAACRQTASPGGFPGLTATVGYLDMGAVQHMETGGPPVPPLIARGDRYPAY